jgi:hypothetical protein
VITSGIALHDYEGFSSSLRLSYFGLQTFSIRLNRFRYDFGWEESIIIAKLQRELSALRASQYKDDDPSTVESYR